MLMQSGDTLNYYRRHITSGGSFACIASSGRASKRSMGRRNACIVFHLLFCGHPKEWKLNMQSTGHRALVFMVTFVSSLFIQTEYNYVILQPNGPLCYHYLFNKDEEQSHRLARSRPTVDGWLQLCAVVVIATDEYCFCWLDQNAMHVRVIFWHRRRLISAHGVNRNMCFYSPIWIGTCTLKMHHLPGRGPPASWRFVNVVHWVASLDTIAIDQFHMEFFVSFVNCIFRCLLLMLRIVHSLWKSIKDWNGENDSTEISVCFVFDWHITPWSNMIAQLKKHVQREMAWVDACAFRGL